MGPESEARILANLELLLERLARLEGVVMAQVGALPTVRDRLAALEAVSDPT